MKVLIADDNQRIRSLIRKLLNQLPYEICILECENGEAAIEVFNSNKPDLILMDIMMEKLDGLSATRSIMHISSSAKIIIISQLSEQECKQEALNAGAVDYLNKEDLYKLPEIVEKITGKWC